MAITTKALDGITAADSFDVNVDDGSSVQVWTSPRLPSGKSITAYSIDSDDTVEEILVEDGEVVACTQQKARIRLAGPGVFRFKKDATTAATSVFYDV